MASKPIKIRLTVSRWGNDGGPRGHGQKVRDEGERYLCAYWRTLIFGTDAPEIGTYEVTGTVRKVVARPKRKARKNGKSNGQ